MAQWRAGCILIPRRAGTPRRPGGGNDETIYEIYDDRCGRPDGDSRSSFGPGHHEGGGSFRFSRRQPGDGTGYDPAEISQYEQDQRCNDREQLRREARLHGAAAVGAQCTQGLGSQRSGEAGFDCSSGTCVLAKVWYGEGYAYDFYGPKKKSGETMLTEIVMKPDRAD